MLVQGRGEERGAKEMTSVLAESFSPYGVMCEFVLWRF